MSLASRRPRELRWCAADRRSCPLPSCRGWTIARRSGAAYVRRRADGKPDCCASRPFQDRREGARTPRSRLRLGCSWLWLTALARSWCEAVEHECDHRPHSIVSWLMGGRSSPGIADRATAPTGRFRRLSGHRRTTSNPGGFAVATTRSNHRSSGWCCRSSRKAAPGGQRTFEGVARSHRSGRAIVSAAQTSSSGSGDVAARVGHADANGVCRTDVARVGQVGEGGCTLAEEWSAGS